MNAPQQTPVIQVDFKRAARKYVSLGGGLYKRSDGTFWERPTVNGVRTIRALNARTEKAARIELGKMRSDQAMAAIGLAKDPYQRTQLLTIADLAKFYLEADCPKRDRTPREGKQLQDEKTRVARIVEFFGRKQWDQVTLEECAAYHAWRTKSIARANSKGDRVVDLELTALSSMFRWASRHDKRTGVKSNPLVHDRPRFRDPKKVRHCRDVQPANGDELHQLAAYFFADRKSAVLGWQLLFEAMIGHRTNEILRLRWDAQSKDDPGFIVHEKRRGKLEPKTLYLYRSAGHKGAYGHIDIHPALREALEALEQWRALNYPSSPWFFPSYLDKGAQPVHKDSLTHGLKRACQELGLPHRTSHGLRSYYANVLRSDRDHEGRPKLSDAEIALRMGHRSSRMIITTYGEITPDRITWLPQTGDPAWTAFTGKRPVQLTLDLGS